MLTSEWKLEDALAVREMEGEARGEARGRLEGELEAQRKFVNNMYRGGFSVADIIKVTGLSERDINDILGV